ncbi:AraC family transcriptional regulator [Sinomonas cyclohexanicum]|uniref:AraC family transcriptional regulator n=1 Tax=Sinomonas cyclohexanicum TaxID=322009 RepID=A0ABM7PZA8_SINCY|nr:AraC family transcriptional regulator [Corynebacterium cyclohexanicum]BCT77640.1 AraC family transcriptional regulator [Corynebacterium cyclohexanicum]
MAGFSGVLPAGFTRFSTDGLPDSHRIPEWEVHNARALVGLAAKTDGRAPLRATELNLALPRLQLARVSGTPHRVERDESHISAHPARGIVAYFALQGSGTFYHRHGCETVAPGQGIVVDADQPFERGFADGLTELALKVPRAAVVRLLGSPNLARPRLFDFRAGAHDAGPAAPAARLAGALGAALRGRAVAWDEFEDELIGLLGAVLAHGGAHDGAGHFRASLAVIAARHSDPALDAASIAAAVGVSERQLSRIFSSEGTSVPSAVMDARLAVANRLLMAPEHADLPMAEVAARTGFASQAQFSRSYRQRYGLPPLRHRRELLAG